MSDVQRSSSWEVRVLAEAVAEVLLERGLLVAPGPGSPARVLDAAQVGAILGRDRHWVYAHARELGAFRFGDGPRARLGFDLAAVERWMRTRLIDSSSPRSPAGRPRRPARKSASQTLISYDRALSNSRASRTRA